MGADGISIGTGSQNTIDIETGCLTTGTAADVCANLTLDRYGDWFLPSKDELNLMWTNLANTIENGNSTGFADTNNIGDLSYYNYWSSTKDNIDNAWMQNFRTSNQWHRAKYSNYWACAIHAF